MFSIRLQCEPDQEDTLAADLWEAGTTGIIEEPGGVRAFFDDSVSAPELLSYFAQFSPELRVEADTNWEQVTREAWRPVEVGQRFFLAPPWCEEPTPPGRMRLEINPGMACGTGQHPCTQLCLAAWEKYMRPGARVLDVGAGSGILSNGAALLGARRAVACDIDPEAVQVARERIGVPLFVGSADAVRSRSCDVVIANISSAAVEALRPELWRVLNAGGTLILSGFPNWDLPDGFEPRDELRREEWVCLVC